MLFTSSEGATFSFIRNPAAHLRQREVVIQGREVASSPSQWDVDASALFNNEDAGYTFRNRALVVLLASTEVSATSLSLSYLHYF